VLIQPLFLVLELHGHVFAGEGFEVPGNHGFDLHIEVLAPRIETVGRAGGIVVRARLS
jgi:hypothetical protein